MADTPAKKEKQKKKEKAKQDKAQKMKERKENSNKGKKLEDMLAYVDEDGNLSATPPDPRNKKTVNAEDISLNVSRPPAEIARKGVVTFYNEAKGYGFITDAKSKESVFVHANQLSEPLKEKDNVTFETERTPKGLTAINVKKV